MRVGTVLYPFSLVQIPPKFHKVVNDLIANFELLRDNVNDGECDDEEVCAPYSLRRLNVLLTDPSRRRHVWAI